MTIHNLEQAHSRLQQVLVAMEELRAFFQSAETATSTVNKLMRGGQTEPAKPAETGRSMDSAKPQKSNRSWVDGVREILETSTGPLWQKGIVAEYRRLGWVDSNIDDRDLYIAVAGAVRYLSNKKRVIEKTENGYRVKR